MTPIKGDLVGMADSFPNSLLMLADGAQALQQIFTIPVLTAMLVVLIVLIGALLFQATSPKEDTSASAPSSADNDTIEPPSTAVMSPHSGSPNPPPITSLSEDASATAELEPMESTQQMSLRRSEPLLAMEQLTALAESDPAQAAPLLGVRGRWFAAANAYERGGLAFEAARVWLSLARLPEAERCLQAVGHRVVDDERIRARERRYVAV